MTSPGSKGISEGDVEHVIRSTQSSWDRKIATDLISEMAAFFGEVDTVPQMRQALAIAGYHELQRLIEIAIEGKTKLDADIQCPAKGTIKAVIHRSNGGVDLTC